MKAYVAVMACLVFTLSTFGAMIHAGALTRGHGTLGGLLLWLLPISVSALIMAVTGAEVTLRERNHEERH